MKDPEAAPEGTVLATRHRDALLRKLRKLVSEQPEEAKRAGKYLQDRALKSLGTFTEKRAKLAQDERAVIELARRIVLGRAKMPGLPRKRVAPWDRLESQERLNRIVEYVEIFRRRQAKKKDLRSVSAIEAYLDEHVALYRAAEKQEGEKPTPAERLRTRRRSELAGPDGSETEELFPLHLAVAIRTIMDRSPDALRARKDWWRIVVGVLLIEDPDTPPVSLGITIPITQDEWNESNGSVNLLAHREGMRHYSSIHPAAGTPERKRWISMWELARRAKRFLVEPVPGSPAAARSSEPEPVVAPDFSWIRSGGTVFHFTKPSQRAVISALYKEWKRGGADGCGLTVSALAEAVDSAAERLRVDRIFSGHPCLDRILRRSGKTWALHLRQE